MSSDNRQEDFIIFLFIIAAICAAVAFVVYLIFLFWPYLVFYILPFVVGSVLVGWLLRFFTIESAADSSPESEHSADAVHYIPRFNHKNLVYVYSSLILLVLFVFQFGSTYRIEVDKKGRQTAIYLEWPKVNQKFNEWRAEAYRSSPFDSLKEKAKYAQIYDRRDVAWIAWLCLVFGGPAFFLWLSGGDFLEEKKRMFQIVDSRLKNQRGRLETSHKWREEQIRKESADLLNNYRQLQGAAAALRAENLSLKARVEFSDDKKKLPPAGSDGGGILDKGIL